MALTDILKVPFEFSPKLGIRDLPEIGADHQSNVPGLYVVGDLADAPIIKVALNQGYEVACDVAKELKGSRGSDGVVDVAIIGAGPAGIGAALACQDAGVSYVVFEKERPFNTIQNFPKKKLIFSEPRDMENKGNFWFEDASKEELVERWDDALDERSFVLHQPEEVTNIDKDGHFTITTEVGQGGRQTGFQRLDGDSSPKAGDTNTYKARRVILAIGRRAAVRRLEIPGEDLDKVQYVLRDPDDHTGRKVLVVGGGDSAVEAALSCADAGAEVTISYRRDQFSRAKKQNADDIEAAIDAGRITFAANTVPVEVREDVVVLDEDGETREIPNDDVLIFIGTELPKSFLRKIGLRMAGEMTVLRVAWIVSFALLTYLFYVLKSGARFDEAVQQYVPKKAFWPFGPDHILGFVPDWLHVDLGFRAVDGAFWGTVLYSMMILGFGILAYRKYPSPVQKKRYLSLIGFQWVFLFGIPEIIAPLVINGSPLVASIFGGDRGWKFYSISVPWPLNIWALIDAPGWTASGSTAVAVGWLATGAFVSFVAMPLFVWRFNEKFCSYLCGCGGLAETFGDRWRHLAPRGRTAQQAEWFGVVIFALAIPVTGLIVADAWQLLSSGALLTTKGFAEHWYTLMVDFWLASVVGVAFYPYLGNRVWCRFFCPLRAYMEGLARLFGRLAIVSNEKCIGCGECTRYCQMGIDVQGFAQKEETFDNTNSACIQCGICVQVCPMDVLELVDKKTA